MRTCWLRRLAAAVLLLVALPRAASSSPATITLFDGSLGTLPAAQGWLTYAAVGLAVQAVVPGGVSLDTTTFGSNSWAAGYSSHAPDGTPTNPAYPSLSATTGFRLDFTATLSAEAHANPNRAGFSVIALDSTGNGVELGFWTNTVWAQDGDSGNLFTQAESASFATTVTTRYSLSIAGGTYTLSTANGPLLSGPTRSYHTFSGFPDVYEIPNFVFLGDDTSSARATVVLGDVKLTIPVLTTFTDQPLTAGITVIKAVHITELRTAIDALRTRYTLGLFNWSDPALAGGTLVRAQHILELRSALSQVYTAASLPQPAYADPVVDSSTLIKAVHISEIRQAITSIESTLN